MTEEVVVAANTNTDPSEAQTVDVIVDSTLNETGATFQILFSNKFEIQPRPKRCARLAP